MKRAYSLIAAVGLMSAAPAMADVQTWDFVYGAGTGIENNDAHGLGSGTYIDMTSGGIELVISAWSSSGNSGSCSAGDPACDSSHNAYDQDPFIQRADLKKYAGYGLGAVNADEGDDNPNHSFDNIGSATGWLDYDMALLQFDTAVALEEIDINWRGTDSDMTVLTYTGGGTLAGNPFGASSTWTDLLNNGWSHVGNYADVSTSSNAIISSATESRYYLVGVYNPGFGTDNWSYGNDAIKIAGITTSTGNTTEVPEPASALLLAAGLFGLARRQRKMS
ncbi:PEP-CTERM sorting domain-containing protein [Aestuariibacter halophilus]|uniref:PEP-CTERM sorting domain-containing protein n=1 Tax=Fluctibacter halophilus TaxID=226011 RepID=A0ABS8G6C7_9ALTE|nr:exosortase-dependent surface protein XDP1 [Aestuariibacter halophilus]MCC2614761.1 PEP-CTERM sorting domain-containing protein [Aestuariibacter halophilus]